MPSAAAVHGELITGPARGAPRRADQRPGPGPAVSSQEGLLMIDLSWKLRGASWSLAPRLSSEGLAALETDERPMGTPGHTDPPPSHPRSCSVGGASPQTHTQQRTRKQCFPLCPRPRGSGVDVLPEPAAAEGRQQPPGSRSASPRAPDTAPASLRAAVGCVLRLCLLPARNIIRAPDVLAPPRSQQLLMFPLFLGVLLFPDYCIVGTIGV